MFERFIEKCLYHYYFTSYPIHIFLISLFLYLYFGVMSTLDTAFLSPIFSLLQLFAFLILLIYFVVFLFKIFYINAKRSMIFMISVSIMCFGLAQIDTGNIILSLLQDLSVAIAMGGVIYVWIGILAIQPDESYPTFKRWGRNLNPFKKKKDNKK